MGKNIVVVASSHLANTKLSFYISDNLMGMKVSIFSQMFDELYVWCGQQKIGSGYHHFQT
ncbi:TPA: hypothetical protein ACN37W_004114 [Vibrio parahaemolyticus]